MQFVKKEKRKKEELQPLAPSRSWRVVRTVPHFGKVFTPYMGGSGRILFLGLPKWIEREKFWALEEFGLDPAPQGKNIFL